MSILNSKDEIELTMTGQLYSKEKPAEYTLINPLYTGNCYYYLYKCETMGWRFYVYSLFALLSYTHCLANLNNLNYKSNPILSHI